MAQRKYRTAQGKMVDFGAMLTNNELEPALGNMNVNARGDEISRDCTIVKSREEVMKQYYDMNTMVPEEGAIPEGGAPAIADDEVLVDDWADWQPKDPAIEDTQTEVSTSQEPTNVAAMVQQTASTDEPKGTLANSVANTRTLKTPVEKGAFAEPPHLKRL
jgi:hypothetical protein